MANSALKMLAQKAKKRLSTIGQDLFEVPETKTTFAYLASGSYAIVASKQKLEEDPLYEKVKKLTYEENVFNPLSKLVDRQEFEKLSQADKERYMLDISRRYNKLKEHFLQNKNS